MRRLTVAAFASLTLVLMACGGKPAATVATPAPVTPAPTAVPGAPVFARGMVAIETHGGQVNLKVEIADDEAKREYGLMNRTSLPADAGMVFLFNPAANAQLTGFWMKDTLIPLSVAFVEPNLAIESIQDMQPMTQDIHYAPRDYSYAIEANLGYFASHGVNVGDAIQVLT